MKKLIDTKSFRELILYSISFVLNKFGIYLLLPFYTRYLSTIEYGKYEMITVFFAAFLPIGLLGMDKAALRFFEKDNDNYNNQISKILNKYFKVSAVIYILLSIVLYLYDKNLFNYSVVLVLVFILKLFMEAKNHVYKNTLRIQGKSKKYFAIDLGSFMISIISGLLLIKYSQNKYSAVLISYVISSLVGNVFYLMDVTRGKLKRFDFDKGIEKELLKYSIPIMFSGIANWIFTLSDRVVLQVYTNYSEVAMYSAGYRLASLAQFLIYGFGLLWPRLALDLYKLEDTEKKISILLENIFYLLSSFSIILIIILKYTMRFFYNTTYFDSYTVIPWVVAGFIFMGIDLITSIGLFYNKKSMYMLRITFVAAIFNLILNIVFVETFGYVFIAISTFASNLLIMLMRMYYSNKMINLIFNNRIIVIFISYIFLVIYMAYDFYFSLIGVIIYIVIIARLFNYKKLIAVFRH